MADHFAIFHLDRPAGELSLPENYWHLGTCLRSMVFSLGTKSTDVPTALADYQQLRGEEAYAFVLQIICGLESPLLGETEVLGQFKEFIKENFSSFPSEMQDIFECLIRDAKKIRAEYLQNIGSTSYGSLLRKKLRDRPDQLSILGAGSLAQDIIPWFAKKKSAVHVYTRNPMKYVKKLQTYSNVELKNYQSVSSSQKGVLVIAAPLKAAEISQLCDLKNYQQVFDLRENSHEDALEHSHVMNLKTLFANIESNKKQAQEIKENAVAAIRSQAVKIRHLEKPRPFGWETCGHTHSRPKK